jgi:hypothetical protein
LKENNKIIYEYEVEDNDIINIIEISYWQHTYLW